MSEKTKTKIVCSNCGYTWQTVRRYEAYCPKCGVVNTVSKRGLLECPCLLVRSFCLNRTRETCTECAKEDKFRHLEPECLNNWEQFNLPSFAELLEMSPHAKLAVLFLALYYITAKMNRDV